MIKDPSDVQPLEVSKKLRRPTERRDNEDQPNTMWREHLENHPISLSTWQLSEAEVKSADSPVWLVGQRPSSWAEDGEKRWVEVETNATPEGSEGAFGYILPMDLSEVDQLPSPSAIYFTSLPLNLGSLRNLAKASGNLFLPEEPSQSSGVTGSSTASSLKSWLVEAGQPDASGHVYASASDLLTAMGEPITPQPVFERGVQQLEETLQSLKEEGWLKEVQPVSYRLKVHSINKFKEIFLRDEPELLDFYKAYEAMKLELNNLETLKLTLFNNKDFDLRDFASRLPYSVADLNSIFSQLHDKKLAIVDLHTAPTHQRVDPEYQLTLRNTQQANLAVQLWSECGDIRPTLVWASDASAELEALTELFKQNSKDAEFWSSLAEASKSNDSDNALVEWAGYTLGQLELSSTDAASAAWEWVSASLKVPGMGEEALLGILPQASDVTDELKDVLQGMLERYLTQDKPSKALYEYVLGLPESFGFKSQVTGFLEAEAPSLLALNTADRHSGAIKQFLSVAKKESPTSEATEDSEKTEKSGKKDRKRRPSYLPQSWSIAAGWAESLQGHTRNAWQWVELVTPSTSREAYCCSTIALQAQQPVKALQWLEIAQQDGLTLPPLLLSDLYQQLFSVCKAQARCKKCVLHATSFCPDSLDTLIALNGKRPELSTENFEYTVAKRIRADLESNSTETIRALLSHDLGQESERVQRAILHQLAQRDEASIEEYKRLAQWSESYGDFKNALVYREKVKESEPNDPANLQKLADLNIRDGQIQRALELAMEATENHPRKFPLEIWVKRNHDLLFSSLDALRQTLIDLPAHPILSALEEELTQAEEAMKQLKPQIEAAEAAMEAGNWGEARTLVEDILETYPKQAPAHLQDMLQTVSQSERRLWQKLKRLPRKPKDRNQYLEELAAEAKSHGLTKLVDASFRKLLQLSPQYGLGYLKWGRATASLERMADAYEKAISLSKGPQQARNNVDEYLNALADRGELARAVPVLLEYAKAEEEKVPKDYLEKIFLRMVKRYGTQEDIAGPIREFLGTPEREKSFKKVQKSLDKFDNMEPWKQALLSIKNKQKG